MTQEIQEATENTPESTAENAVESAAEKLCYCGSGKAFEACCEPIIKGSEKARTPEELMRARFSAHCVQDYPFLVESTHPDHREGVTEEEISKWATHINWTELEVLSATPGLNENEGNVSFIAHFTIKNSEQMLREDAFFNKVDDTWLYVDGHVYGEEPYRRETPRVGRNEPCPCGSGKKYKKCCGRDNA